MRLFALFILVFLLSILQIYIITSIFSLNSEYDKLLIEVKAHGDAIKAHGDAITEAVKVVNNNVKEINKWLLKLKENKLVEQCQYVNVSVVTSTGTATVNANGLSLPEKGY